MANKTLLQIVQDFCLRTGLRSPSSVASSTNVQDVQIMALANELCEEMVDRWVFEYNTQETTFTSVGTQNQGSIDTIAPIGFDRIINDTIYDRTQKIPIYGPLSAQAWQQAQAFVPVGPIYRYRIRNGNLMFDPVPPAGHTCAFEYVSKFLVLDPLSGDNKEYFTADTDEWPLASRLMLEGLRWKWKAEKGLPYAQEKDLWETSVGNAAARSGSKPKIYMDGSSDQVVEPMIIVPPGSWPLS